MTHLDLHIPVAPNNWIRFNGLATPVLDAQSVYPMVERYYLKWLPQLTNAGITAKGWLYNPFGRWNPSPVYGSALAWTSMRLDAAMLSKARLPWLYQSVRDQCDLHGLGVYIGANPVSGLSLTSLLPFRRHGVTFDASALQFGTVVDTFIQGMARDSLPVYREANRIHDDEVPAVAEPDDWERGDKRPAKFHRLETSPAGSVVWFPRGIDYTEYGWTWAERAIRAGRVLRVNMPQTDVGRLIELLKGAE